MREKGASSLPFFFLPLIKGEQKNAASGGLAGKRKEKTRRNNRQKKEKRERDVFFFFANKKTSFDVSFFSFFLFSKGHKALSLCPTPTCSLSFFYRLILIIGFTKKGGKEETKKENNFLLLPLRQQQQQQKRTSLIYPLSTSRPRACLLGRTFPSRRSAKSTSAPGGPRPRRRGGLPARGRRR